MIEKMREAKGGSYAKGELDNNFIEHGSCKVCRTAISVIHNSLSSLRADKKRFIYRHEEDKGWGIFRCKICRNVIDETFTPKV